MELVSIEFSNFRQFEAFDGEPQRIDFALSGPRNVTAIYGTNGAGKSGVLNAFTWVLFGKTTKALKHPWNLVNKRALKASQPGTLVRATVRLQFKARVAGQSVLHVIERSCEEVAPGNPPTDPDRAQAPAGKAILTYSRPGVGTMMLEDPGEISAYIEQIIPEDLFQYFFIDGERIANLTKPENEDDVRHAVEVFVGLQELQSGAKHLREAADIFDREVRDHEKHNEKLKDLLAKKEAIEGKMGRLGANIEEQKQTAEELEREIRTITENLERNKETRIVEEERKNLQVQIDVAEEKLQRTEAELFREVMQRGWGAFGLDATRLFLETSIDLRRKGELPYKIRRPFIQELLDRLECICGRSLDLDTCEATKRPEIEEAKKILLAELEKPDLSSVQTQLFGATAAATEVSRERVELQAVISAKNNAISDFDLRLDNLRDALAKKAQVLRETEDAKELVQRRDELTGKLTSLNQLIGINKAEIERAKEELTGILNDLDGLDVTNEAAATAKKRASVCRKVAGVMADYLELEKQVVRAELEERIREIFQRYSITGYIPRVSDGYALSLVERIGQHEIVVSDSTGEGQTLSLAFITGVAEAATKRREDAVFSIVIDSQFGSLDRNYHRRIGSTLPACVGQVVLIQTKTQWSEEMRAALRNRIGAEFVLTRRVTRGDLAGGLPAEEGKELEVDETIDVQTGKLPYVELSNTDSTFIRVAK
ncbi:AAA family ATPase [Corallococcus sp. M7]